jgi:hypothetical protein
MRSRGSTLEASICLGRTDMKFLLIRLLLSSTLFAGVALAQNSDLAILLGISGPNSVTIGNGRVSTSVGAGLQLNYAAQLHETKAGQLYLEIPLMFAASVDTNVGFGVNSNVGAGTFITPGVRWRFTPQKRVSFYAAGGVGVGIFANTATAVRSGDFSSNAASVRVGTTASAAFGFGGGIDFRLTRLLSLRFEGRDFVTGDQGGTARRNHTFFMGGIGFHF